MIPSPFYPPIGVVEEMVDCYIYEKQNIKNVYRTLCFAFRGAEYNLDNL